MNDDEYIISNDRMKTTSEKRLFYQSNNDHLVFYFSNSSVDSLNYIFIRISALFYSFSRIVTASISKNTEICFRSQAILRKCYGRAKQTVPEIRYAETKLIDQLYVL